MSHSQRPTMPIPPPPGTDTPRTILAARLRALAADVLAGVYDGAAVEWALTQLVRTPDQYVAAPSHTPMIDTRNY